MKPAPVAAKIAAPKPSRAPLTDDAKRRRRLLKVAAILLVGATSPLWMKPFTHLRDTLLARAKPPSTSSTAHPPAPFATSTAAVMPAIPSDPAEAE